jgi:hypothetical protein
MDMPPLPPLRRASAPPAEAESSIPAPPSSAPSTPAPSTPAPSRDASGWGTLESEPAEARQPTTQDAPARDELPPLPALAESSAQTEPATLAEPTASAPKPRRGGVTLPVLIGIGVVALLIGAGGLLGARTFLQPSALESVPERCHLAEGGYELSETALTIPAPADVSAAPRFAGDVACVAYVLGGEDTQIEEGGTLPDLEGLEGYTATIDPESGDFTVEQS